MILKFWLDQYLEGVKYLRLHLHEYHTAWYDVEMILLRNHRRKTRRVLDWNWFLSASDLLPSATAENHRDSSNVKWIFLRRELEVVSNQACLNDFDDIYEETTECTLWKNRKFVKEIYHVNGYARKLNYKTLDFCSKAVRVFANPIIKHLNSTKTLK